MELMTLPCTKQYELYLRNTTMGIAFIFFSTATIHTQDFTQGFINTHRDFISGIVELKKGNCEKAGKLFEEHERILLDSKKSYYQERSRQLISTCISNNSNPSSTTMTKSYTNQTPSRIKIRKQRVVLKTTQMPTSDKPIAVSVKDKSAEIKPKAAEVNKKSTFGLKFATRSEGNHQFISLTNLGPIISVENSGRYDYYITNIKKESEADRMADNLINQGFKDLAVYKMDAAEPITEIKKVANRVEPVQNPVTTCAVIVHSLQDAAKIQQAKDEIISAGYTVFIEQIGNFFRIGVSSTCDEAEINILLEKLRKQFNPKAWLRK